MADSSPPFIQGSGDWGGYIGAGVTNLTDQARQAAMAAAGNAAIAYQQIPSVSDAAREQAKLIAAWTQPSFATAQSLANVPLSQVEQQYGSKVAEFTQLYHTAYPTAKAQEIQQQYAQQSTNIISSGGIQKYLGSTADKRFAIYSEAGGTTPFQANVLTTGQQGEFAKQVRENIETGKAFALEKIGGISTIPMSLLQTEYAKLVPQETKIVQQSGKTSAGSDIGSPMAVTQQPSYTTVTPAAAITPTLGTETVGPVRSKKEAIEFGQIATAAKIDVTGRAGYHEGAPIGSQQWGENLVELSSAYHNIAQETGKQQAANPFEYTGDLALSYLKGTNKGSASSTYGENITDTSILNLPGGLGIQDVAWQRATVGKGGEQPAVLEGYAPAISAIQKSVGQYGPYASLYGGPGYGATVIGATPIAPVAMTPIITPAKTFEEGGVTYKSPYIATRAETTITPATGEIFGINIPLVSPTLAFSQPGTISTTRTTGTTTMPEVTTLKETKYTPIVGGVLEEKVYETTGGKVEQKGTVVAATPSGFESWLGGANKAVASAFGFDKITPLTTEQIKGTSSIFTAIPMTATIGMALKTPILSDYTASYLKGESEAMLTKPISAGVGFGAGILMGGVFKGVEAGVGAARAATASKVISEGGLYRGAEMFSSKVMEVAPKAMGGLYVVDIAGRATAWGTDISPKSAERLGGIAATEARPMFFGGLIGYAAPGAVYKAARVSDIGYKSALQEGATTGRIDYYVKQPSASAYETVKSPVTKARLELPQFVEESGGNTIKGVSNFIEYKVGTAYKSGVEIPLKSAAQELGVSAKAAQYKIIEPFTRAKVTGLPTAEVALGRTSIDIARWRYGETPTIGERVYGKYLEAKISAPAKVETALISGETKLWELGQTAKTPRITLKSYLQEKQPLSGAKDIWDIYLRHPISGPTKEISTLNKLAALQRETGIIGIGGAGTERGVGVFKTGFGGVGGITTKTTPYGGAGAASRITSTKVVGGRTIPSLAREPSLKSTGVAEPSGKQPTAGRTIGRSVDYRGAPASERMKPLGGSKTKQAAGEIAILTERLPTVEGMPTGRVTTERVVGLPYQIGRTVQPQALETEFDVEPITRREQRTSLVPTTQLAQRGASASELADISKSRISEVEEAQRVAITPISSLAQLERVAQTIKQTQEQRRSVVTTPFSESATRQTPESLRTTVTTPRQTITPATRLTTTPRITTVVTPKITTITTPTIIPTITPVITPTIIPTRGGFPSFSGGPGAESRRLRSKKFTKTLAVGEGVGWINIFNQPKPQPKPQPRKRKR